MSNLARKTKKTLKVFYREKMSVPKSRSCTLGWQENSQSAQRNINELVELAYGLESERPEVVPLLTLRSGHERIFSLGSI